MIPEERERRIKSLLIRVPRHHGGPSLKLPSSDKSPRRRGDSSPQTAEVRVIMRDGEILQPGSMKKILNQNPSPIPRSESQLTERYRRLAGVPAKTNPGAIERNRHGRDLDNR